MTYEFEGRLVHSAAEEDSIQVKYCTFRVMLLGCF